MNILLLQSPPASNYFVPAGLAYLKTFLQKRDKVKVLDLSPLYFHREPGIWNRLSKVNYYYDSREFLTLLKEVGESSDKNHTNPLITHIKSLARYSAEKILEDYSFEVIGFSVSNETLILSLEIAGQIRKLWPDANVILGGPAFCNMSSLDILPGFKEMDFWDAVVFGEGEATLFEIVENLKKSQMVETKGALVRTVNGAVYGGERGEIEIDCLPYPDFSDFKFKFYLNPFILPIVASRGCIGRCRFCRERLFWKEYRLRSPENVVAEISYMKEKYGFHSFVFFDSLINGNPSWLESFCKLLIERDLEITWEANARISHVMTGKMLRLLKKSGCVRLKYGVESASPRVLENMAKGVRATLVPSVIGRTRESGIRVHSYMIVNYPGETCSDILDTLKFLYAHIYDLDGATFHTYVETIENRRGDCEYDYSHLIRPNLLQFFSFIHRFSDDRDFHRNYLTLLIGVYSRILDIDHFLDLSSSPIGGKESEIFHEKSIFGRISLNARSIETAIENIGRISPARLILALSWDNVGISRLRNRVSHIFSRIDDTGIKFQTMKSIPPCLYGKKRESLCRICFCFVNLSYLELSRYVLKYDKKLSFEDFQYIFCRSRISHFCRGCVDLSKGLCIGICNAPGIQELRIIQASNPGKTVR